MSTKKYEHIEPDLRKWPINIFSEKREGFVNELTETTCKELLHSEEDIEKLLSKTIYMESQRIKNNPWNVDPRNEQVFWKRSKKRLQKSKGFSLKKAKSAQYGLLKRIVRSYSEEIVGHFRIKTFKFARRFLTVLFKPIYNSFSGNGPIWSWGKRKHLLDQIKVHGHIDQIRSLMQKGTVVILPTHFSNLDSIMIGYILDQKVGIPSFTFGAGLNLFNIEVAAFYMNRLGPYRVDRRKKNKIYLKTLKNMSSLSLQKGLNSLFFPGGTRSRSGAIELQLKMGLLSTVIEAQRSLYQSGKNEKIFIVPMVLGYHFVFEASALIEQHLRITGKEKYLRRYNPKNIVLQISRTLNKFFYKRSEIHMVLGQPLDVMGNPVNEEGRSTNQSGHPITLKEYFMQGDQIDVNPQRETVYTRLLADKVVHYFKKENIVLSSHLVAFAAFQIISRRLYPMDIWNIVVLKADKQIIFEEELLRIIGQLQLVLQRMQENKNIRLSQEINSDAKSILEHGLYHLGTYNYRKALKRIRKRELVSEDLKLLYYYHNRLTGYDLEQFVTIKDTFEDLFFEEE